MTPQVIAAMIVDRTAWEVIAPQVSPKTLTPVTGLVFSGISKYYGLDQQAEFVDLSVLEDQVVAGLANPKWAPEVKQLLSVVNEVAPSVSSKNVKEVFRIYKEDTIARELAAKLASSDRTGAVDLMAEYQQLFDVSDIEKEPELADLVAERFNKEGLMPILPMALNEALDGGARKEHHLLVFGRPECYSADTEVLTVDGWLPFPQLSPRHTVAQVHDDGTVSYTVPSRIVSQYVEEDLLHVHNQKGQVDLLVTKEHDLVYYYNGCVRKEKAGRLVWRQGKKHILSGCMGGDTYGELSPHERLLVAFQADGTFGNKACNGAYSGYLSYRFSFSKERKLERLRGIVEACGYPASFYKLKGGKTEVHVRVPVEVDMPKDFSWVKPATRTAGWLCAFVEELSYWDATRRTTSRYKFDTTNKEIADVVQEACALCGYSCFLSVAADTRKESYSDVYRLSIRTDTAFVDGQSISVHPVKYHGRVYCCTVETGMLIVRRNGKVAVSGNSGKSLVSINIACGLAKFGARGIFFENEDRTDDTRLRFWCNLSGMDKHQIRENPRRAQEIATSNGIRNLRVQPLSPGTPGEIKYFVKSEKPDFIVVNQIRNLHVRAGTRTEQLERAATEMRNIAKKHGVLVLSITQAGDSATDKTILDQGDVDGSNTGIPSQMDAMIGVGLTENYDQNAMRHLSMCKNKLGNCGRWDAAFKIDRARSMVVEK